MSDADARRAVEKPIREIVFTPPTTVGGTRKVLAIPGTIHLALPDVARTIRWENKTGDLVSIWLANLQDVLFPLHNEDLSQPQSIADGDQLEVGVNLGDNPPEFQRDYHVFCDAVGDYAEGGSSPHMSSP